MVYSNNIFSSIRTAYETMTKSERKVANFVLENPQRLLSMTILDVAAECGIGDTSVFRFCRTLGLHGYQELKSTLSRAIYENGTNTLVPGLNSKIVPDDSMEEICRKLFAGDTAALGETVELLNYDALDKAVELLFKAKHINFLGIGLSGIVARQAHSLFLRITDKTRFASDGHEQGMQAALLTEKDVAVLFSHTGKTTDILLAAEIAKKSGAKLVCVTRYPKSPLTEYADVVLLHSGDKGYYQWGELSAAICQLFLVEAIYTAYYVRTFDASVKNKRASEKAIALINEGKTT